MRQTEYQFEYVIGAACPETGQAEAIIAPRVDTEMINRFLEEFSRSLPADVHALLAWDGAGYHRAKALLVSPNIISLVRLPPYSHVLNPIENLWHYLKSHYWSNRAYDGYDHLFGVAVAAWCKVYLQPTNIRSICAAPYAFID